MLFRSRCRCCFRFFDHFIAFFLRFFIILPCRKHFNRSQRFQMTFMCCLKEKLFAPVKSGFLLVLIVHCERTKRIHLLFFFFIAPCLLHSLFFSFCSSLPGRYSFYSKNSFLLEHFYFIFVSFLDHYLGFSIQLASSFETFLVSMFI